MTEFDQKREHPRVELILKITYKEKEGFMADYAANASEGGLFIATDKPFRVGDQLAFSISFPGLLSPIECRGEVRWRREPGEATDDDPAGIGVAFVFDEEDASERIRTLVEKVSYEPDEQPPAPADAPPFRVLLAEGDPAARGKVRYALDKFHSIRMGTQHVMELKEAETNEAAWELLVGQDFDLAVIDLTTEALKGKDLVFRIRKEGKSTTLPVIAIRADHDEARKEAHEAGADLSLRKPVELTLLFESLHRLMGVEFS